MCSDPIVQSSSKLVVLNMTVPTTKPFIYVAKIVQMKNDRDTLSYFFIDNFNNDLYSIPINEVLCKSSDRELLIHTSLMELPVILNKNEKKLFINLLGLQTFIIFGINKL